MICLSDMFFLFSIPGVYFVTKSKRKGKRKSHIFIFKKPFGNIKWIVHPKMKITP